ncbi:hypothetical protein [Streptomyces sp. PU-14G]|uniref:hypothetical protein n=1 Tax=Streptomyces sp. PU-14G TaxID=2800808 RepID=UPI0034DEFA8D
MTATPAQAGLDDITHMCGPVNVPAPEYRGKGIEAFFGTNKGDSLVSKEEKATYIPSADEGYDGPKASYHRYGLAGLSWHVFGERPGCFELSRYTNFIPNMIFDVSKTFAAFTMALIGWSFGADPFAFLNKPIGNVAKAMSDVAGTFLGLVGVLGAVYLGLKNWGPNGRLTAVLKGVGWMGLITGLFFWFAANPTALGSKVNSIVGEVTATGFQSLAKLPTEGSEESTRICADGKIGGDVGPAACVQDALWVPLVYQPWLYGQVGNSQEAASKWGDQMLNAQFVGVDEHGKVDEDGQKVISNITHWNGNGDEVGGDSKSGSLLWDENFDETVPYLKLWGNDICHEQEDKNFRICWGGKDTGWFSDDEMQVKPEDRPMMAVAGGEDFMARMSAAGMSVMGGVIINVSVYFVCAMLLAAKLGLFVLMVFAPLYLMLGIFPGPSRVAAIKLGELVLANLFRQVGWSLGLVIITYMDTIILAPGGAQNWVLKILTCALMTAMFGVYARPTLRALSGMAMGDKSAGDAVVGVGANLAKQTAALGAQAGMAVATGGASAAMSVSGAASAAAASGQSLSVAQGAKAAGAGFFKNIDTPFDRLRGSRGLGRKSYEDGEARREERESNEAVRRSEPARRGMAQQRRERTQAKAHDAAKEYVSGLRDSGLDVEAEQLERQHFDSLRDPRTGAWHRDDPRHERNRIGTVDDMRRVRAVRSGSEMLAQQGLSSHEQAADNLDSVLGMYGGDAAQIDRSHDAAVALRVLAMQQASGYANTGAARETAAEAVRRYGVPDRIDAVGMQSGAVTHVQVQQMAQELTANPLPTEASARQRMEYLVRVEQMAEQVPVGTVVSTALNDLRHTVSDAKETFPDVREAVRRVQSAADQLRDNGGRI